MKFVVSTKPLKNALSLGVIKSNISKFYYRSGLIQIKIAEDKLKLNIEATGIKTTMTLSGSASGEGADGIIVDCVAFKGLIDSIDSDVITLDISDGGLSISAGTSKFTLPQQLDINEVQLNEPITEYSEATEFVINPTDWKFVLEHQKFALANIDKANHPVYTYAFVGDDNTLITGDYDASLFTSSAHGNFNGSCLLPLSLINLFSSLPDGSKIIKVDKEYILNISADSYSISTEFTPKYEDDPAVGSYKADIISGLLKHPDNSIIIKIQPILTFINQVSLLSQGEFDQVITLTVDNQSLKVSNGSNEYVAQIESSENYSINFNTSDIKSVLSNFDTDTINLGTRVQDDEIVGGIFWSDDLNILLASRD